MVSHCYLDLHFLDPGEGDHLFRCILATWDNAPECDLSHLSGERSVLLLLIVGVTILYVWASTHSLSYMLKKSIFCLLTCLLVLFMFFWHVKAFKKFVCNPTCPSPLHGTWLLYLVLKCHLYTEVKYSILFSIFFCRNMTVPPICTAKYVEHIKCSACAQVHNIIIKNHAFS